MANTATPLALLPKHETPRRQIERLTDRVRELEECLGARTEFPGHLQLSRHCAVILGMLIRREVVTYDMLNIVLYGSNPNGGPANPRSVIIQLTRNLRERLKLTCPGIVILTAREVGYFMPEESKERLRKMIA